MKKGDTIYIKAAITRGSALVSLKKIACKILSRHNGYCVLDAGKYRVCAFVNDIINQIPVYI